MYRGAEGVRPRRAAVVLTGYGNIATAVTAVKLGAVDYLAKPADADDVYQALCSAEMQAPPPENPMSADRCAGSTSSASTSFATATSRRRRGGSTCIGARCSAFSPSAPPK
jgi:FixJ family two-component response regulator